MERTTSVVVELDDKRLSFLYSQSRKEGVSLADMIGICIDAAAAIEAAVTAEQERTQGLLQFPTTNESNNLLGGAHMLSQEVVLPSIDPKPELME